MKKIAAQILQSFNKRLASYPKIRSQLKKLLVFILPNSVIYFLKKNQTVDCHDLSKQDPSDPTLTNYEHSFYTRLLDKHQKTFR